MLPMSARTAETFSPPGYEDRPEGERPSFRLKVPTRLERVKFRQAMTASGLAFPSGSRMLLLLRELVEQLPAGERREEQERLLLRLEDKARADAGGADEFEPISEEEARAALTLEGLALRHYPPYAEALAQRNAYVEAMPIVLFRLFCIGWSGYPAPFARNHEGVDELAMDALPEADINAAAGRLFQLLRPAGDAAKNSAGPSPSSSDRKTSTAPKKRRTAAKAG